MKQNKKKKNTNSICLYIKISISPFFLKFFCLFFCFKSLLLWGSLPGDESRAESVVRVRTSTQNTSMQKVKTNPYRYNFKVLASKLRNSTGGGDGRQKKTKTKKQNKIISQHLLTEHINLLQVFSTLLFFFLLSFFFSSVLI